MEENVMLEQILEDYKNSLIGISSYATNSSKYQDALINNLSEKIMNVLNENGINNVPLEVIMDEVRLSLIKEHSCKDSKFNIDVTVALGIGATSAKIDEIKKEQDGTKKQMKESEMFDTWKQIQQDIIAELDSIKEINMNSNYSNCTRNIIGEINSFNSEFYNNPDVLMRVIADVNCSIREELDMQYRNLKTDVVDSMIEKQFQLMQKLSNHHLHSNSTIISSNTDENNQVINNSYDSSLIFGSDSLNLEELEKGRSK